MEKPHITRLEIIDHTKDAGCMVTTGGSGLIFTTGILETPFNVEISLQDSGKTLKLFMTNGE